MGRYTPDWVIEVIRRNTIEWQLGRLKFVALRNGMIERLADNDKRLFLVQVGRWEINLLWSR